MHIAGEAHLICVHIMAVVGDMKQQMVNAGFNLCWPIVAVGNA